MAIDGALGPTNAPLNVPNQTTAANAQRGENRGNNFIGVPGSSDAIPAWGIGMVLGEMIDDDWMQNDDSIQGALGKKKFTKDEFKSLMCGMMCEVMKSMGNSTKYLKEMDEDEDSVKGLLYQ